jgi:hypothetical protein
MPWIHFKLSPLDWFAWLKYGKTYNQLGVESGTNYEACRQLAELRLLCERGRFSFRKAQPKSDFLFKTDEAHTVVFFVAVPFGLHHLSAVERAHFFDDHCPCGKKEHDIESLRKQWARFKKTWLSTMPAFHRSPVAVRAFIP